MYKEAIEKAKEKIDGLFNTEGLDDLITTSMKYAIFEYAECVLGESGGNN